MSSSIESLCGLGLEISCSTLHDSIDLHSVAWICDHHGQVFLHTDFGKLEGTINVGPELGLWVLCRVDVVLDLVHTNGSHNSVSSKVTLILLKSWSEACLGIDIAGNRHLSSLGTEEFACS